MSNEAEQALREAYFRLAELERRMKAIEDMIGATSLQALNLNSAAS